jgi:transposase
MSNRTRRQFSDEFKADAVKLCQLGDRSIAKVAKDLGLTDGSLRQWVRQAEADANPQQSDALSTAERHELAVLRKEIKYLRMEREILKKAAAFFAKETL